MLIIAGLGNPGDRYARNRHNVGFMAADAVADAHAFGPSRRKFQADVRDGRLGGARALIVKPVTYMNESGQAVRAAAQFYKVAPENVVVIYDEIDLAPGKVRARTGGGHAGHNGVRSLIAHLGAGFRRVRVGVGRPGDKAGVHGHVLGDFAKADEAWLAPLLEAMAEAAPALVDGDAAFSSELARVRTAHGAGAPPAASAEKRPPNASTRDAGAADAREKPNAAPGAPGNAPRGAIADALSALVKRKE
ncbi:MAG: aminoacyl-tRNA hydrolase [Pseudomonadota bacterium]